MKVAPSIPDLTEALALETFADVPTVSSSAACQAHGQDEQIAWERQDLSRFVETPVFEFAA